MAKHVSRHDLLGGAVLVAGLIIPVILYFALGAFWAYDVKTWFLTGQMAYEHGLFSPYSLQAGMSSEFPGGYYNYPMPWLLFCYAAYAAKQAFSLDIAQWMYLVRLPELVFTLASALLLHFWLRPRIGERGAALAAFAFTVFPGIANVVFGPIIGYFDPIPVFFSLFALVLFERKRLDWAALSLGLGAAFKYYPLLMLPVFLLSLKRKEDAVKFATLAVLPLLIVSMPPLVFDAGAYIKASTFISDWAGSTSLYRLAYSALGWDTHLWFGKAVPPGVDLSLLPIVSAASTLILLAAVLLAYAAFYRRKLPLNDGILLVMLALLGFWRFAEHNHALWAFPFAAAVLFTSKRLRPFAAIWLLAVFLMSLPYVLLVPDWFEPASAMLVPLASIAFYVAIAWSGRSAGTLKKK